MTISDSKLHESDAALERLLEEASPRPAPSAEAIARARLAVHDEWQQTVGRRVRRQRIGWFAAAATVVLAVAAVLNLGPAPQPVLVATVDKSAGAIYLLGEGSILNELGEPAEFQTGQTVVTGEEAGLGLAWQGGGSLRLDENTEVRFVSLDRVELFSGRVYFDSQDPAAGTTLLTIETAHGDVTHIGTQFITETTPERLIVSVRDGRVEIDGHRHRVVADAGEALTLRGDAQPERLDIRGYGPYWEWVETAGPVVDMNGRTLEALLDWVCRETGLEVEFEPAELRTEAIGHELSKGDISETPRVALDQFLIGYGLDYEIQDGVIRIREPGSR